MQQAKDLHLRVQHQTAQGEKKTMKQNMSFTIYYIVNMKNSAKMHAFSSDQATSK